MAIVVSVTLLFHSGFITRFGKWTTLAYWKPWLLTFHAGSIEGTNKKAYACLTKFGVRSASRFEPMHGKILTLTLFLTFWPCDFWLQRSNVSRGHTERHGMSHRHYKIQYERLQMSKGLQRSKRPYHVTNKRYGLSREHYESPDEPGYHAYDDDKLLQVMENAVMAFLRAWQAICNNSFKAFAWSCSNIAYNQFGKNRFV